MSSPAYRGRHRAPAGRHRAAGAAFRPDPTTRPTGSRGPRIAGAGYLLPAAAAATLVLTATGAHLGSAASGAGTSSASSASGSGASAAAMLTASGLSTADALAADPIQRSTEDRAARSAVRGSSTGTSTGTSAATGSSSDGATDATPSSTEEQAKYDAEAAGAAKMQGEANAAAQAQADAAAQAQAAADAAAKAQADAAAQAHAWVKFIDGGYDLTSGFGMRWGSMHPGQDFAVPVGTPVKAMSAGTVIFAGWQGGYGNKVEIQYWDGTVSWFAHNSKLLVSQGDTVTPGQVVSLSGNTGHSTGPHIHVEIHPAGGDPVPPIPWLTKMGTMP